MPWSPDPLVPVTHATPRTFLNGLAIVSNYWGLVSTTHSTHSQGFTQWAGQPSDIHLRVHLHSRAFLLAPEVQDGVSRHLSTCGQVRMESPSGTLGLQLWPRPWDSMAPWGKTSGWGGFLQSRDAILSKHREGAPEPCPFQLLMFCPVSRASESIPPSRVKCSERASWGSGYQLNLMSFSSRCGNGLNKQAFRIC